MADVSRIAQLECEIKALKLSSKPKPSAKRARTKRSKSRPSSVSRKRSPSVTSTKSVGKTPVQFSVSRSDDKILSCIGPHPDASTRTKFRKIQKSGTTHWFSFRTPYVERCFCFHYRKVQVRSITEGTCRYTNAVTLDFQSSSIPSDWYKLENNKDVAETIRNLFSRAVEQYISNALAYESTAGIITNYHNDLAD
ncbi:hypothetical protein QKS33_gp3 [Insect mesonivirus 1]|uniref:Uncharacterized protein n=1 Tax=Insect mesonivirus 1 TaxID=2819081 RepID=A0AAE7JCD7_9NIDO|nr:hypothetical protein QKS33_gp3 [Insect mesonivirus 1]QNM37792.1 hypothetical protein [Insect mesonivirus 1]